MDYKLPGAGPSQKINHVTGPAGYETDVFIMSKANVFAHVLGTGYTRLSI